jgi:hypothetical protein
MLPCPKVVSESSVSRAGLMMASETPLRGGTQWLPRTSTPGGARPFPGGAETSSAGKPR